MGRHGHFKTKSVTENDDNRVLLKLKRQHNESSHAQESLSGPGTQTFHKQDECPRH